MVSVHLQMWPVGEGRLAGIGLDPEVAESKVCSYLLSSQQAYDSVCRILGTWW